MSTMKKFGLQALSVAVVLLTALPAFAADEAAANAFNVKTWAAIGAGLAIGLAVLGGAMGQGRAAAAALEGISRNPGAAAKIQTPMILGLALMESLVLLGFVIAYFLYTFASAG